MKPWGVSNSSKSIGSQYCICVSSPPGMVCLFVAFFFSSLHLEVVSFFCGNVITNGENMYCVVESNITVGGTNHHHLL